MNNSDTPVTQEQGTETRQKYLLFDNDKTEFIPEIQGLCVNYHCSSTVHPKT